MTAKITLNQPRFYKFVPVKVPLVFSSPCHLCVCISKQTALFYFHAKLVETALLEMLYFIFSVHFMIPNSI